MLNIEKAEQALAHTKKNGAERYQLQKFKNEISRRENLVDV